MIAMMGPSSLLGGAMAAASGRVSRTPPASGSGTEGFRGGAKPGAPRSLASFAAVERESKQDTAFSVEVGHAQACLAAKSYPKARWHEHDTGNRRQRTPPSRCGRRSSQGQNCRIPVRPCRLKSGFFHIATGDTSSW